MPKPVQRPGPPFLIGGGGKKVLALAGREAKIVGINANLRSGEGDHATPRSRSCPRRPIRSCAWLREAAGVGFDDLEIQTFSASCTSPTRRRDREGDRRSFGVSEDDACSAPATLVGIADGIVELLEQPPRTLADVATSWCRSRPRKLSRRSWRASPERKRR